MSEKDENVSSTQERARRKTAQGLVVSDKMDKTVVVAVEDRVKHALYGKVMRRTERLKAHELDELNDIDLEAKLREAKEELFNLRFQAATGQLESHGRLRSVKRDIARIYTVVRERELGIRTNPGADQADNDKEEASA
jgi:large subunit ribosomal protein L29